MILKNYTNISDARIREIIQHLRPNGISKFDVRISNSKTCIFRGCCYYNGAGCHDTGNPFIIIRITKHEEAFPYFARYIPQIRTHTRINLKTLKSESVSYSTGTGGYIDHLLLSREEAIVHVCAHELRHLWQKEHKRGRVWGARGRFSDRDADAYAIRKTREWRRQQNNNTTGLGSWP